MGNDEIVCSCRPSSPLKIVEYKGYDNANTGYVDFIECGLWKIDFRFEVKGNHINGYI